MVKTPRIVQKYYMYGIVLFVILFAVLTIYTVAKSYTDSSKSDLSKRESEVSKDIKNQHTRYKQHLVETITGYNESTVSLNNKVDILINISSQLLEVVNTLDTQAEEIVEISKYHKKIYQNKSSYRDKILRINSLSKVLNCYERIDIKSKTLTKDINSCELIIIDKYSILFPNTSLYTNASREYWQLVNRLYANKITDTKLNKEVESKYNELDKYRTLSEDEINQFIENNY